MRPTLDPIEVALKVAEALEKSGVSYLVGGSVASSIYGEPRSTLDIDMVVALSDSQLDSLVADLGDDFYADVESVRRAVKTGSAANLVHLPTGIKVDLFVVGGSPIDEQQMQRRRRVRVSKDPEKYLYVYTAEDILLQKLRWYRLGNETSDRQWRDVLGIVLVQGERLERPYLEEGADRLGVRDLLERALAEGAET